MFPETFVSEQLLAYTRPGDVVFDPFSGRGTTLLESLLQGRRAIATDINPVAACVSKAKSAVPTIDSILARLDALEQDFNFFERVATESNEFFAACFESKTFEEICYLRNSLNWREDPIDCFIAAVVLGVLHGESHRTALVLSNRMPRTISTKPEYSVRWWKERGLLPPRREVFNILRASVRFRLTKQPPDLQGRVSLSDARRAAEVFPEHEGGVAMIVTSPPYLDTTDYSEDQWLRLWFLGGEDRPRHRINRDDRHTDIKDYWRFLSEIWSGLSSLLREESTIVIRIGGTKLTREMLFEGLLVGLSSSLSGRMVRPLHSGKSSEIAKRQTNAFRPGTKPDRLEHDFVFLVR